MTTPDADRIRGLIAADVVERVERVDVFAEIDSTNTYLKAQQPPAAGYLIAAVADHQTAGRGCRDREWLSAPGSSLCLSVSYSFRRMPADVAPLTLALGTGVVRCLTELGQPEVRLKWPNDLLIGDAKLGGILTETRSRDRSDLSVVAGVGINVDVSESIAADDQSGWSHNAVGLSATMRELPSRDRLAALVINALFNTLNRYDDDGFDYFKKYFEVLDWLTGKSVVVDTPTGDVNGVAAGIDDSGALCIDTDSGQAKVVSGSIRHVAAGGAGR